MKVYRLVMRRSIMYLMIERLRQCYDLELPEVSHLINGLSHHEFGALLSLGSDPTLDRLRGALGRLDNGTFGRCLECNTRIGWPLLLRDPVRRVCAGCAEESWNSIPGAPLSAYPNPSGNFAPP